MFLFLFCLRASKVRQELWLLFAKWCSRHTPCITLQTLARTNTHTQTHIFHLHISTFTSYIHLTYILHTSYIHFMHLRCVFLHLIYILYTFWLYIIILILYTFYIHLIYILYTSYIHLIYILYINILCLSSPSLSLSLSLSPLFLPSGLRIVKLRHRFHYAEIYLENAAPQSEHLDQALTLTLTVNHRKPLSEYKSSTDPK
jgi:hypothetical protein